MASINAVLVSAKEVRLGSPSVLTRPAIERRRCVGRHKESVIQYRNDRAWYFCIQLGPFVGTFARALRWGQVAYGLTSCCIVGVGVEDNVGLVVGDVVTV